LKKVLALKDEKDASNGVVLRATMSFAEFVKSGLDLEETQYVFFLVLCHY
jgi:hypothetical protein